MEHGPSVGVLFTLAVFLTSTCVVHSVPPPAPVPVPASVAVQFDTTAATGYKDSRSSQHSMLLKAGEGSKIVGKHGILPRAPKDRKVKPKRWLQVDLVGADHDTASLYFRHDNLYLLGFANRTRHVHYLKGNAALFPAGSTEVPFAENYDSLTGMHPTAISDVLQKVPLGQHAPQAATHALATYQGHTTQDQSAKSAVLTFCLMVAEAQRFHPVGDKGEEEWLRTRFLSEEEAQYIGNWSLLSFLYCRKDKGEPWTKGKAQMDRMKIHTQKQLRDVLDLVLWVEKCDDMHDEN